MSIFMFITLKNIWNIAWRRESICVCFFFPDVAKPPPIPLMDLMAKANAKDSEGIVSALLPVWSFGLNRQVPVINLSTLNRKWIFYASSHLGILYDIQGNGQFVLQGHVSAMHRQKSRRHKSKRQKHNFVLVSCCFVSVCLLSLWFLSFAHFLLTLSFCSFCLLLVNTRCSYFKVDTTIKLQSSR